MIRMDGSGRDGIEEEKAFPLTYSLSFAFFLFFPFSSSFFFFFFLFFWIIFQCTYIKILGEFTWNEDMEESLFLKRVCTNVKQNVKGYVHVRRM